MIHLKINQYVDKKFKKSAETPLTGLTPPHAAPISGQGVDFYRQGWWSFK
jgi:hypothetical protein